MIVRGVALERWGSGEPLMLIHGTGGSRFHWEPVMQLLAENREVLVIDLPGHGESPPPPDDVPHTPAGYARVISGMLDELSIPRPHVSGNSVGGWTALELAKLDRARSVVAIAPAGLWAKRNPRRASAQLSLEYRLGRALAPLTERLLRRAGTRSLVMGGQVAKPKAMPGDAAVQLARIYSSTPTFKEHLSQTSRTRFEGGQGIQVPVTVAWGDKERLIPRKARRREQLPPTARFVTLEGCGHLAMWDDPEGVANLILEGAQVS